MSTIKVDTIQHSGGTTGLTVDSNGRVKYPAQVRFHARGNNNAYVTTATVPFPSATINLGNCYNTSTYKFTAPIDGCYYFYACVYGRADTSETAVIRFKKNTDENVGSYGAFHLDNMNTGGKGAGQPSCSIIIDLAASDTMLVNFSGTGDYYNGAGECTFMGYLLG